jgi:hypothetical protein
MEENSALRRTRAYTRRSQTVSDTQVLVHNFHKFFEVYGRTRQIAEGVANSLTPIISTTALDWLFTDAGKHGEVVGTTHVDTQSLDIGAAAESALEDPNANVLIVWARKYSDTVRPVLVAAVKGGEAIARLVIQTKSIPEAERLVSRLRDAVFPRAEHDLNHGGGDHAGHDVVPHAWTDQMD